MSIYFNHPALQILSEMLEIPAPSGREERMAQYIRGKVTAAGYTAEMDGAGNVLVRLEGREAAAPTVCYAAHMDEIGFVVSAIGEDGVLQVRRSGGLLPWKFGEGMVQIVADGEFEPVRGVLSMGSTHTAEERQSAVRWEDVRVLTGHTAEQLAELGVRVGSPGVAMRERRGPFLLGDTADPLVAAWTFDDRLGCVMLVRLLEEMKGANLRPLAPTLIAFTVQEEVGGNGAKFLCQREQPDILVAVDGAPMPPEAKLKLDGRPALWSKDQLAHYDAGLIAAFQAAAHEAGTEAQTVAYEGNASDASLAYYAGAVGRIACFGHVRENSHGFEVIRRSVCQNVLQTLLTFVDRFDGQTMQ